MLRDKKSQTSEVLKFMKSHGGITSMQAFEYFGATRLSAIIFSLRHQGYEIETQLVEGITRYGSPVSFARYVLINEPKNEEEK